MDNILEQNNNDPLGVKTGSGATSSDPLKAKGGSGAADNDPLKVKGGSGAADNDPLKTKNDANDPLKVKTNTAPVTSSVFDCLLKDADLKLSADKQNVKYEANNKKWTFFTNNRVNVNGNMGSWSCDGTDAYIVKLDDGSDEYSSKTGWKSKQNNNNNNTNTNTNTTTLVDTNLTGDELKAGKVVKIGMKGPIVGTIQDLLIKLGYTDVSSSGKADSKFGKRTQKMVKDFQTANSLNDDGEVGKDTWPKLNDPAAVKNSSSSESGALGGAKADIPKDGETTAGSDAIIIKESLRKSLRKNLLKFN